MLLLMFLRFNDECYLKIDTYWRFLMTQKSHPLLSKADAVKS